MSEDTNSVPSSVQPSEDEEFRKLVDAELTEIAKRRFDRGLPSDAPVIDRTLSGLALSGGGVRSATFALGVMQSLVAHGWLDKVDYLSTVSGGGYLGAYISSWWEVCT